MKVIAAILAAGRGTRFGRDKLAVSVGDRPVWRWSYDAFANHPEIDGVILVGRPDNLETLRQVPAIAHVLGGDRRQDSTLAAVEACPEGTEILLVHDGARPFVNEETISRVVAAARANGAAAACVPVVDSITCLRDGSVTSLDRTTLRAMQTPQGVRIDWLREALAKATTEYTDELSMVQSLGHAVQLVDGSPENFKVTHASDVLRARAKFGGPLTRTGFGYDVHRFSTDTSRTLMLGGIAFPGAMALDGHSDADVLLHAATDAILGARADGDIGVHFANTDPRWHGAPSIKFLEFAYERAKSAGYTLVNLDIAVVAEKPKIMPKAAEMRQTIARALGVADSQISIKATTNEGMGAIGREEGIAAWAVATLREA